MRAVVSRWMSALALLAALWCGLAYSGIAQAEAGTTQAATPAPVQFVAPKFNIEPVGNFKDPWFAVSMDAGQSVNMTAAVKNFGTVPANLSTFATNAVNPPNGGFTAGNQDDKPTG